ncbi:MAG: hypothetical protein KDK27_03080, partial [Leptospiraceae bacterium]|nr:hypothetical protein [Leptospiraceae bacterium]
EGLDMLRGSIDPQRLGAMLNEEHRILSETLGISTPAIDSILTDCLEAGALGGKINGSGGGGTCFCYAPGRVDAVSEMLTAKKVRHFRIHKDSGARLEMN